MSLRSFFQRPRVETYRHNVTDNYLAASEPSAENGALSKIVRYIPGEVVGMYVSLSGIIEGAVSARGGAFGLTQLAWYWIGFLFFLVGSPFWMWLTTARVGKPTQWFQVCVTPFAFAVWALALGGPFKLWLGDVATGGDYSPVFASVILLIVTAAIGLVDQFLDVLARRRQEEKEKAERERVERERGNGPGPGG